jgi:hypothetical protein
VYRQSTFLKTPSRAVLTSSPGTIISATGHRSRENGDESMTVGTSDANTTTGRRSTVCHARSSASMRFATDGHFGLLSSNQLGSTSTPPQSSSSSSSSSADDPFRAQCNPQSPSSAFDQSKSSCKYSCFARAPGDPPCQALRLPCRPLGGRLAERTAAFQLSMR